MTHHTKSKGDVGLTKVVADLTEKGISVYLPISDYLPIDLIAIKNDKPIRIQCKFISKPNDKNGSIGYRRNKRQDSNTPYSKDDFDYYAIYLADVGKVIYPSIDFAGMTIRTKVPERITSSGYYWYEDFLNFTNDLAIKRYK